MPEPWGVKANTQSITINQLNIRQYFVHFICYVCEIYPWQLG